MVKGCGNSCMKFILFAFNFVFVVIGVTLVTMGTYLLVKSKDFDKIVETPDAAAILVIIVGSVTFLIAFLGCCGASQESSCMLTTYAIVVGLVFLLEIAGAILLLVYTGQITDIARDGVRQAVNKYDPTQVNPPAPINGFVDILQWSLKCCGL
ncbi:Leukocyte surface antigen CD53 [Halotydeus destructor]|nr:Leukocyte surface antigen CD53 [Halotydeus destructor]